MNTIRKIKQCPGCDGDGSKMYQWAKSQCIVTRGAKRKLPDGSWYYVDGQGREIGFKTIGGCCSLCKGYGNIELFLSLLPDEQTQHNKPKPSIGQVVNFNHKGE